MTQTEVGFLKIKDRERFKGGSPSGMRPGWREYQVWRGRKIVSRHDTFGQAYKAAQQHLQDWCDKLVGG